MMVPHIVIKSGIVAAPPADTLRLIYLTRLECTRLNLDTGLGYDKLINTTDLISHLLSLELIQ